jgi:hypothetical protein
MESKEITRKAREELDHIVIPLAKEVKTVQDLRALLYLVDGLLGVEEDETNE